MTTRWGLAIFCFASLLLTSTAGFALDNDPALYRLCVGVGTAQGGSMRFPSSGEYAVFQIAYERICGRAFTDFARTSRNDGHQRFPVQRKLCDDNDQCGAGLLAGRQVEMESPPNSLVVSRIGIRKGLPGSMKLGMNTSYLFFSELWMFGVMASGLRMRGVDTVPVDFCASRYL